MHVPQKPALTYCAVEYTIVIFYIYKYINLLCLIFRTCSSIKHILEVAKGFYATREYKEIPKSVSKISKRLAHAHQVRNEKDRAVDKADDCLTQIRHFRQQFEQLEQRTISELEKLKTSLRIQIQADVNSIDDVNESLNMMVDALKDESKAHEALAYITYTKLEDMIKKTQDFENKDTFNIFFQVDNTFLKYWSSLEVLGKLVCKEGERNMPLGPNRMFNVENQVLYNVKMPNDAFICMISGMCALPSGELLLADSINSKLKLFSRRNGIKDTLDAPNTTWDVCSTGNMEAAVTVENHQDRHEIWLVRVQEGQIKQLRTIQLEHYCLALAHYGSKLFITALNALHEFDLTSGQSRQLYSDTRGFTTVYKSAVSHDGNRIFITNKDNNQLITLDKEGTKLSELPHPYIKGPRAVQVTTEGQVFVSCPNVRTIVQVWDEDGKQTVKTLTGRNDIHTTIWTDPKALCLVDNNTLVVSHYFNDEIVELNLKCE